MPGIGKWPIISFRAPLRWPGVQLNLDGERLLIEQVGGVRDAVGAMRLLISLGLLYWRNIF